MATVEEMARQMKESSAEMAASAVEVRNQALIVIRDALREHAEEIFAENKKDMDAAAEADAEKRQLLDQIEALKKAATVAGSAELTTFKVHFETAQASVNAMIGCAKKLETNGDAEGAGKLRGALRTLLEKTLEAI